MKHLKRHINNNLKYLVNWLDANKIFLNVKKNKKTQKWSSLNLKRVYLSELLN